MKIARIVLAAGASQRMGQVKALLDFDGTTALERINSLPLGQSVHESQTFLVTGCHSDSILGHAQGLKLTTVHNESWQDGQTSSIRCGFEAAGPHWDGYILHPVDLPLVTAQDYSRVMDAYEAASADRARIAVASFEGRRGHPVIFAPCYRQEFLSLLADEPGHKIIRGASDHVVLVPCDNPWVLHDLDHPKDYQAALDFLRDKSD